MTKLKNTLNYLLIITFILTVMVPLIGIQARKMASTVFLILTIAHTIVYRKKMGAKKYFLLAIVFIAFVSGLFGMILDQYPIILNLHKAISIISALSLAIHIFVYQKGFFEKEKGERLKHYNLSTIPQKGAQTQAPQSPSKNGLFKEARRVCNSSGAGRHEIALPL